MWQRSVKHLSSLSCRMSSAAVARASLSSSVAARRMARHASVAGAPLRRAFATPSSQHVDEFSSQDGLWEEAWAETDRADPTGRLQVYALTAPTWAMTAGAGAGAVWTAITSMSASADVLALGTIEVDISAIPVGKSVTVKWRGKPVFIRHRPQAEIDTATADDAASLRDPEPDAARVQKPEWLVVLGICTHLGCVPIGSAGDYNGWFCPCHGSHYDTSGRIRKGPAPLNLEVPTYSFVTDSTLLLVLEFSKAFGIDFPWLQPFAAIDLLKTGFRDAAESAVWVFPYDESAGFPFTSPKEGTIRPLGGPMGPARLEGADDEHDEHDEQDAEDSTMHS